MRTPVVDELARNRHTSAVVAGLVVGCFLTWNVANAGAAADPLAEAYGVSLAVVGLLTTALFLTHLLAQLPSGIWSDRSAHTAWRSRHVRSQRPETRSC